MGQSSPEWQYDCAQAFETQLAIHKQVKVLLNCHTVDQLLFLHMPRHTQLVGGQYNNKV
jgi:hypothetical protein